MGNIVSIEDMEAKCLSLRAGVSPPKIVLTNGCFDPLQPGHLATLRFAAKLGDLLIVAVNTDESVRVLKGPHSPRYPLEERVAVVAALDLVHFVLPFGTAHNPTIEPVLERLKVDVHVKGGDYTHGTVVGGAIVEKHGGRVVIGPVVPPVRTRETGVGQSNIADCIARYPPADTCLIDLDGVLVDTHGAMARLLGLDLRPETLKGRWELDRVFNLPSDWFAMFGPDFWESAPWTSDGRDILHVGLDHFPPESVFLCSSPTRDSSSAMGKLRWIERHLDESWLRRYVLTPCKHLLARPNVVLIDDCDANVRQFVGLGGQAILVPRPWNSFYAFQGNVPEIMARRLETMKGGDR
jgi:rfaE bifunctional protein nucleotidyltransferase chain/domain